MNIQEQGVKGGKISNRTLGMVKVEFDYNKKQYIVIDDYEGKEGVYKKSIDTTIYIRDGESEYKFTSFDDLIERLTSKKRLNHLRSDLIKEIKLCKGIYGFKNDIGLAETLLAFNTTQQSATYLLSVDENSITSVTEQWDSCSTEMDDPIVHLWDDLCTSTLLAVYEVLESKPSTEHPHDVLFNIYEFEDNVFDSDASYDGKMFETYGEEVQHVLSFANNEDPEERAKVWTIVEGGNDSICISQGYHLVNRIGYLISKTPALPEHRDDAVCFIEYFEDHEELE